MAQSSDKYWFRFVWSIENFSMCPLGKGESISCCNFVVDGLDKTKWYLKLYPYGELSSDVECVVCFLRRANGEEQEPEKLNVFYDIKLAQLHAKSYIISVVKHPAEKTSEHGYGVLITLQKLTENKDTFLPNDVLTVMCFIWRGVEREDLGSSRKKINITTSLVNKALFLEETFTVFSEEKGSTAQRLDRCAVTTTIPVQKSVIRWTIQDFQTRMQNVGKIPVLLVTKIGKKLALLLQCYVNYYDKEDYLGISIRRKDEQLEQMLLLCKVSILTRNGLALDCFNGKHLFGGEYSVCFCPSIIQMTILENPESVFLNDGALVLQCEFSISFRSQSISINDDELQVNNILTKNLLTDVRQMLNDKELADVTLISEGLEIPIHKFVISARSPVFRAMFTNDTEEKRTGVVHINDIDADTLRNLKHFMYGKHLPGLQHKQIMKLYSAADKYQVLLLKECCLDSLKSTLSISNVCEVLVLADLHEDGELLDYVHDFLRLHSIDVLESDEWNNFMENNIKLATNTMKTIIITLTILSRCPL